MFKYIKILYYLQILTLILYIIFYIFIGVPVQFAMRALGQYSKCTVINLWNFCPFFKGVGFMVLAYAVYYMLRSAAFVSVFLYMFFDVLRGTTGWNTCDYKSGSCVEHETADTEYYSCDESGLLRDNWPNLFTSGIAYYHAVVKDAFSDYETNLKWYGLLNLLIVWFVILFFMALGFEKFIKVVNFLFSPLSLIGVILLAVILGSETFDTAVGLGEFFAVNVEVLRYNFDNFIYGEMFYDVLVPNGIINFLACHVPHNVDPMVDTYIYAITDISITCCITLSAFGAAGFLAEHYMTSEATCFLLHRDFTFMSTIPEFLTRINMGGLWVFLYLIYMIVTQFIFIITVAHMTVDSLIDTISYKITSSKGSQSSLILLLVGCGFTYNIFFDCAVDIHLVHKEMSFVIDVLELLIVTIFLMCVVIMYSTSHICSNVYLVTSHKPSSFCQFSLKLSLLLSIILGVISVFRLQEKHHDLRERTVSLLMLLVLLPLIISILKRISTVFHKPEETLFGSHETWGPNPLVTDDDPTRPRYEKTLSCTHCCLRDYTFGRFEEDRLFSIRKCYAIVHAPELYEQMLK